MGRGQWNQAKAQFGGHSGGAGGFYGQVNAPRGMDAVDGLRSGFDSLNQGIANFTNAKLANRKMDMQEEQFAQQYAMNQQKMQMAQKQDEMAAMKFASQQKQQEFQNQLRLKEGQRKQLKTQIEMTDFKNKQELSTIMQNNIESLSEMIDEGDYEKLTTSEEYKTILSGLAAVDPEAAMSTIHDINKKRAAKEGDRKAEATYEVTKDIYINEVPNAIQMIENGTPLNEAMEGIRAKLANVYKSGRVDHAAVTKELKSVLGILKSYESKSGAAPLQSFDDQGNVVDPLTNPGAVKRQVNVQTGKVSNVSEPRGQDPIEMLIMEKIKQRQGR